MATTLADIINAGLPDGATGIRWATGWVDCRTYVESNRFGWEIRMESYDRTIEVGLVTDPCRCSRPEWCAACEVPA